MCRNIVYVIEWIIISLKSPLLNYLDILQAISNYKVLLGIKDFTKIVSFVTRVTKVFCELGHNWFGFNLSLARVHGILKEKHVCIYHY